MCLGLWSSEIMLCPLLMVTVSHLVSWHLLPNSPSLLAQKGVLHWASWKNGQAWSGVMANEQLIEGHFLSLLVWTIFLVVFLKDPSGYDISNDHFFSESLKKNGLNPSIGEKGLNWKHCLIIVVNTVCSLVIWASKGVLETRQLAGRFLNEWGNFPVHLWRI